jgi:hypothetical protein
VGTPGGGVGGLVSTLLGPEAIGRREGVRRCRRGQPLGLVRCGGGGPLSVGVLVGRGSSRVFEPLVFLSSGVSLGVGVAGRRVPVVVGRP